MPDISIQVVNYTSFDFTTVDVKVDEEFASIVTRPNKGNTLKARGGVDKLEWNQGVSWLAVGDSRTELRYSGPASFGFQILTYPQACEIGSRPEWLFSHKKWEKVVDDPSTVWTLPEAEAKELGLNIRVDPVSGHQTLNIVVSLTNLHP